ncbi:MAG: hypothetical protein ATN31_11175 [Candidatus Epulonipiscioides saccharophilum]|nr:MAG: hypothetical protein ATN31_11175 [Epulopiscium sp. AS2M-Bin001]
MKKAFITAVLCFMCILSYSGEMNEVIAMDVNKNIILIEERMIPMELHVYSTEIPWSTGSEKIEIPRAAYTSITDAIKSAIIGDTIIVHEGIYREVLSITKPNLTIKAAEGEYVLITGCDIVTGFIEDEENPGVYVANVPDSYKESTLPFTQVFSNGTYQEIARFPNKTIDDMMAPLEKGGGYNKLVNIYKGSTREGHVTLADTKLPNVDLTGAIFRAVLGKNSDYFVGEVTSHTDDSLTFTSNSKNLWGGTTPIDIENHKFGFGFVMDKALIDQPGEWYVEDRKLYIMPDGNIEDLSIEMQVRPKVLLMDNRNNVKLINLNFTAGNGQIKRSDNTVIEGCTFRYLQPFFITPGYAMNDTRYTGLFLENVNNTKFKDTYLGKTWGNGIYILGGNNNSFVNCITENIGWIGLFTSNIYTSANNTLIEDCTFKDSGRFQIRVDKDLKIDILHSEFTRSMKMGEDAGPIEFTSTGKIAPLNLGGSEVAYNKVYDHHGIPASAKYYNKQFVVAFYMEDVNNYTAHHNLIYNIKADNYNGPEEYKRDGALLYIGPRYNSMHKPVNFYNNTAYNYHSNFNIWNVVIANHEELRKAGLKQEEDRGIMTDGHFANNILSEVAFGYTRMTYNMSSTGALKQKVNSQEDQRSGLNTTDMEKYFEHVAQYNFMFNPEANMDFTLEEADNIYIDPINGDFHLAEGSPAKNAGIHIEGITSSVNPDLGALEGSDDVLSAGATLEIRDFKEIR